MEIDSPFCPFCVEEVGDVIHSFLKCSLAQEACNQVSVSVNLNISVFH